MWYRRFSDPEYNDHCRLLDVHDRVDEYFSKNERSIFSRKVQEGGFSILFAGLDSNDRTRNQSCPEREMTEFSESKDGTRNLSPCPMEVTCRMKHKDMENTGLGLVSKLFFRLLPVQILIVAMGSVNSIVDGVVAGRYIAAESVGVIGLYYTMVRIMEAVGAVMAGGTAVLCGRYMGSGQTEKTQGVFSLNLTVTFLVGAVLTAVSLLMPVQLAVLLGADAALTPDLSAYMTGYAVGIIPQLLAQQIASFLQLELQSRRGTVGVAAMILCNTLFDLLLVPFMGMGLYGLALASSVSSWIYFLILVSYYFTGKAQLKFRIRCVLWEELPALVRIGLPGALLVIAIAAKNLVLNRLLLAFAGADGLSAIAAFYMICGLILAPPLGAGAVVRMLSSVFMGEENRNSVKAVIRVAFTKMMLLILILTVAVVALAPFFSGLFFPDRSSEVFGLACRFFRIYGACIPLVLVCSVFSNYYQAAGHNLFVCILSVVDGFLSVVIPAVCLTPRFAAMGVWTAHVIGLIVTASLSPVYALICCRHWPRSLDEWLLIPDSLGEGERLAFSLHNTDEVTQTAEKVQSFCLSLGVSRRISYFAALCLEEMADNVLRHGFSKDRKGHILDVRVILRDTGIILHMKDDCIPFDPEGRAKLLSGEDPFKNIGIRMVYKLADEVVYQNLLGLNVLKICLSKNGGRQ